MAVDQKDAPVQPEGVSKPLVTVEPTTVTEDADDEKRPAEAPQAAPRRDQQQEAPLANGHASEPAPEQALKPRATFASNARRRIQERKKTFMEKAKPPGGYDATPLPDVPPGYTVKFSFHRATNLPIADIHTGYSDPFIKATLTTNPPNLLKRHKEDPDLIFRTRPDRKTLDPEWDEHWIVANVPASGFKLKCRMYDEDYPAKDDRLGNVTVDVHRLSEEWRDYAQGASFKVRKRSGNKSAYFFKTIFSVLSRTPITPTLWLAIEVLGKSDPPYGKMYTVGPTGWIKHFSPMIGRMIGTKVNRDEGDDVRVETPEAEERKTKKYDFQANEMQLSGPVPPKLYHRYVEFRPLIGLMFSRSGMRGRFLNGMLHKQHRRVYNFDSSTEYGHFEPRSEEAATQFLRMAHFDEGGRIFTYVLTLDGVFRFTETGKEFGIDMLSKHSMHSDVATYIACSGEFFIRRERDVSEKEKGHKRKHSRKKGSKDESGSADEPRKSSSSIKSLKARSRTNSSSKSRHEPQQSKGGEEKLQVPAEDTKAEQDRKSSEEHQPPSSPSKSDQQQPPTSPQSNPPRLQTEHPSFLRTLRRSRLFSHSSSHRPGTANSKASAAPTDPPPTPNLYRLFIDNDSGTYRPDKSLLPDLQGFFESQFPGLNITVHDCDNEELKRMKNEQRDIKKRKGVRINMVLNRSPSASSFSSSDESRLDDMEAEGEDGVVVQSTKDAIKALRKGKGKAVDALVV